MHRKYKLQLTEIGDAKDALQLILNQQDNNRYLLEVERKRGSKFTRVDTVGTQRDGSSFALNDTDYKDRTCVISAGLGTTQVSYNGKSYWVCCSGCKAAFDEDPAPGSRSLRPSRKKSPGAARFLRFDIRNSRESATCVCGSGSTQWS